MQAVIVYILKNFDGWQAEWLLEQAKTTSLTPGQYLEQLKSSDFSVI